MTRESLLVVDDNEMSLDALSRHLERRGFVVTTATTGRRALELAREQKFDLVLLDVMLPDLDGSEVLSRLRERHGESSLPVIMVTARSQGADIVRFLGLGANDYVTKPIDLEVLLARVDTQIRLRSLMQLKDDFLAMASHDLKGPLTAVLTGAEVLRMVMPLGSPLTQEGAALLDGIRERAGFMRRLVEDFLDFQVLRDGRMVIDRSPLDLDDLLQRVVQGNEGIAESRSIRLRLDIHPGARGPIPADASRMSQVVENLLGNALKFGPPGTDVVTGLHPCDGGVEVTVSDEGPGVPEHEREHIFGRYARASDPSSQSKPGSGLGLAIAHRIVDLHGGSIGVRERPAGGAVFWFRLPRAVPAPR